MIQDPVARPAKAPWPTINFDNIGDNYAEGERIKVRCIHPQGIYYNHNRRRQGDVFELVPMYVTEWDPIKLKPVKEDGRFKKRLITAKEQFSDETMELVEEEEPVRITTAKDALQKAVNELDEAKIPPKRR